MPVTLTAGDLAATWLPEHGMVGASLTHRAEELLGQRGGLDAYLAKGSAFGIPLLAPWANRLDGLRYGDVVLDPARVKGGAEGLPKDGGPPGRPYDVTEATTTRVVAHRDADDDVLAVFPFPHRFTVAVELAPTTLTVATTLTATGDRRVPVAFGWHPLFTLPGVPRGELHVELPVAAQAVLDDRGIPTGATTPPAATAHALGDAVLDDEFPTLTGAPFVLRGGGRTLQVRFGPPEFPVGHAWAPEGEAFVAWEPMTAPTNALVSGDGLRHVEPGGAFTATFAVEVAATA